MELEGSTCLTSDSTTKSVIFFTFFCLIQVGLEGSSISCSRTCLFLSFWCVIWEVWVKTSIGLNSGLTCSFWLISCWCYPRIYMTGKYLSKILTALWYFFFNVFSAASWEVYKALLKLVRQVLSCPLLMSMSEAFLVTFTLNKIYTKL